MGQASEALAVLEITEDRSRQFADYWFSLLKVGLVPRRSTFRPEQVPRLLPNMVIHELIAPDFIRLRLAGSAVVEEYGQEIAGRNYLEFVEEPRRAKASRAIFLVCEQPAGMLVQLKSVSRSGRVTTRESIAFPVSSDDGQARFVYFCSSPARERGHVEPEADQLAVLNVLKRSYIDIGAGLPDFRD